MKPTDIPVGGGARIRMKPSDPSAACALHGLSDDEAHAKFAAWYRERKANWARTGERPELSLDVCVDCISRVRARARELAIR